MSYGHAHSVAGTSGGGDDRRDKMHLLLDVEAVRRVIAAPPSHSGLQKRQDLVAHLDARGTTLGRDAYLRMTPKHWKEKNLWRVSLDNLKKIAAALGCSWEEIARVEIGGRLFMVQDRDKEAPSVSDSERSDSEGDDISLDGGRDWVEDYRRERDPFLDAR